MLTNVPYVVIKLKTSLEYTVQYCFRYIFCMRRYS